MQHGTISRVPDLLDGLIIKAQSGFFTVHTNDGDFVCQVRGRLKQERLDTDLVAVGDRVCISLAEDGGGMIEEIAERERALARLAPLARGRGSRRWDRGGYLSEREQVIVANPDQAVFVFSCANPSPSLRMLDRLLVGSEVQQIPAVICANKIDLVGRQEAHTLFEIYKEIDYPVFYASAKTDEGVDALCDALQGKISAFMGPLGVGGWVADTPGIRALALFDVDPEEIDAYFPDIAPLVTNCRFSDCTHTVEPDCAVVQALEAGQVNEHRYESYIKLRTEHQALADTYWWGISS